MDENSVCRDFRHTVEDGKTYQTKYYNLRAITAGSIEVAEVKQAVRSFKIIIFPQQCANTKTIAVQLIVQIELVVQIEPVEIKSSQSVSSPLPTPLQLHFQG